MDHPTEQGIFIDFVPLRRQKFHHLLEQKAVFAEAPEVVRGAPGVNPRRKPE